MKTDVVKLVTFQLGLDIFAADVLSVDRSVLSRTSFGGTAPKNVRDRAKAWLKTLAQDRSKTVPRK